MQSQKNSKRNRRTKTFLLGAENYILVRNLLNISLLQLSTVKYPSTRLTGYGRVDELLKSGSEVVVISNGCDKNVDNKIKKNQKEGQ